MKIGTLYRLTDRAKENLKKTQEKFRFSRLGISIYPKSDNPKTQLTHQTTYSEETVILPLEVYTTSVQGKPLSGDDSRRIVVLLPDGIIGMMYLSLSEWEEAR